jgi:hypothetical protein
MGPNSSKEAERERTAVMFGEWKEALAAANFASEQRQNMQQAIFSFLRFCKGKHAPASVMLAKSYIDAREAQAGNRDETLR